MANYRRLVRKIGRTTRKVTTSYARFHARQSPVVRGLLSAFVAQPRRKK